MDFAKKIKFWIVGLIGLAIVVIVLVAIFSFFVLLLPIAIVLFIIGLLVSILRRNKTQNYTIKTVPPQTSKETIDVEYSIKDTK